MRLTVSVLGVKSIQAGINNLSWNECKVLGTAHKKKELITYLESASNFYQKNVHSNWPLVSFEIE